MPVDRDRAERDRRGMEGEWRDRGMRRRRRRGR